MKLCGPPIFSPIAAENAEANGVADRVSFHKADLLAIPDGPSESRDFDVITANPPYVAEGDPVGREVAHEPTIALQAGDGGLEFIRPIIAEAPGFLAAGGILAMEFGQGQADAVRDLIVATDAFDEPRIIADHQGIERAAVASRLARD